MQKYKKGDRVMVTIGHPMWTNKGVNGVKCFDLSPELTRDIATVEYTYGEKSETDWKFSKGEQGYKQYSLRFDKYGSIAWFDEDVIIPIPDANNSNE